jgi:hypothetical protein
MASATALLKSIGTFSGHRYTITLPLFLKKGTFTILPYWPYQTHT